MTTDLSNILTMLFAGAMIDDEVVTGIEFFRGKPTTFIDIELETHGVKIEIPYAAIEAVQSSYCLQPLETKAIRSE